MRRILVTGMSATGKSAALAELARRGFRTVDTDGPGWTIEDADRGRWWDEERIAQLLADGGPTLYVSGTVTNQGCFYDRFDARGGRRPARRDRGRELGSWECLTSGHLSPRCRTRRSSTGSTRRSPRSPRRTASRRRLSRSSSPTTRVSSSSTSSPSRVSGW